MDPRPRVLLTGAAGRLGRWLRPRLAKQLALRSSDVVDFGEPFPGEEKILGDLADAAAVDQMVAGVEAIIHFGGISIEAPFDQLARANILGTYHVYDAAVRHGVRRVIFASTNHTVGFYRSQERVDPTRPRRPDSLYGVSKGFGEDLARYHYDMFGLESACLRIGSAMRLPRAHRHLSTWLSLADLLRLIERCLLVPKLGFVTMFGVSDNALGKWENPDLEWLGFVAADHAEDHRERIVEASDPVAAQYHGGVAPRRTPSA